MKEEDLIVVKLFLISGGKRKLFPLQKQMLSCLPPRAPQHERGHNLVILVGHVASRGLTSVASSYFVHLQPSLLSPVNQLSKPNTCFLTELRGVTTDQPDEKNRIVLPAVIKYIYFSVSVLATKYQITKLSQSYNSNTSSDIPFLQPFPHSPLQDSQTVKLLHSL